MSTPVPPAGGTPPPYPPGRPPQGPAAPQYYQQPPPPPQDSGGKWLKGCLIALLVVVVLFGALLFVGVKAGKAYIARKMPQWEKSHPWLPVVLNITGLAGDGDEGSGDGPDLTSRQEGKNDRRLLPKDITLETEVIAEAYNIGGGRVTAYQELLQPQEDAASWMRQSMKANGWEAVGDLKAESGDLRLSWKKENRTCRADIMVPAGTTELWLNCTELPTALPGADQKK